MRTVTVSTIFSAKEKGGWDGKGSKGCNKFWQLNPDFALSLSFSALPSSLISGTAIKFRLNFRSWLLRSRLPKFTRMGWDLRPVPLTQQVRPVPPVKIAGNFIMTGQDLRPVRRTGRVWPVCYPSIRYQLESLLRSDCGTALFRCAF